MLVGKSTWQENPRVIGLGLCHAISFQFKVTDVIGFTFAPHWFVKTSTLLHEFHRFMVR